MPILKPVGPIDKQTFIWPILKQAMVGMHAARFEMANLFKMGHPVLKDDPQLY